LFSLFGDLEADPAVDPAAELVGAPTPGR